jgi:hypothetical protein
MSADTTVMLELLEEAGTEAVTLDELGVAGVRDPARALLDLELAGLEIQRVLVREPERDVECVRLAVREEEEQPTVELAAVVPRAAPARVVVQAAPDPRRWVLLAVLVALAALLLRRA